MTIQRGLSKLRSKQFTSTFEFAPHLPHKAGTVCTPQKCSGNKERHQMTKQTFIVTQDDRADIFTTSELEMFYTSTFAASKRIENQERIAGVHGDIVENYIADINQLFEMSEFFASKKLQDSVEAHKDFLRSSDWKHGSSCFSWQELKCLRLQQKLSLQCISLIANSRICEVASVTSKQLNRLVGFIQQCNTKICEM